MRMVEMPGFGSDVGAMGISGAGFAGGHDVIGSCLDSGQRNLSWITSQIAVARKCRYAPNVRANDGNKKRMVSAM